MYDALRFRLSKCVRETNKILIATVKGNDTLKEMSEVEAQTPAPAPVSTVELTEKVPTGKRSFQIKIARKDGKEGPEHTIEGKNRYISKSPAGAARKAASRVFRECYKGIDDACHCYVVIRETTKDSKKAEYPYHATRAVSDKVRKWDFTKAGKEEKEQEGDSDEEGKTVFKYTITLKSDRESKQQRMLREKAEAAAAAAQAQPQPSSA